MPAPEVRAGDTLSNPREAVILTEIVRALDLGQVPLHDVGIVSPYRAQVSTRAHVSCNATSQNMVCKIPAQQCCSELQQAVTVCYSLQALLAVIRIVYVFPALSHYLQQL